MAKKTTKSKNGRGKYTRKPKVAAQTAPEVSGVMEALRQRIATGPTKIRRSEDSRGMILGAFASVLSDVTTAAVQISQQISSAPDFRNTLDQE